MHANWALFRSPTKTPLGAAAQLPCACKQPAPPHCLLLPGLQRGRLATGGRRKTRLALRMPVTPVTACGRAARCGHVSSRVPTADGLQPAVQHRLTAWLRAHPHAPPAGAHEAGRDLHNLVRASPQRHHDSRVCGTRCRRGFSWTYPQQPWRVELCAQLRPNRRRCVVSGC